MNKYETGIILIVLGAVVNIAGIAAEWDFGEVFGRSIAIIPLSGFALGALIVGCALWILGTYLVIVAYGEEEEAEYQAERQIGSLNSQIAQLRSVGITISSNRVTISGGDAAKIVTREINYLLDLRRDGHNEVVDKIISGRKDQDLATALSIHIERLGTFSPHRPAYVWAAEQLKTDDGTSASNEDIS